MYINAILIKTSTDFFFSMEIDKLIIKVTWKFKRIEIAQNNLKTKTKLGNNTIWL